jgi:hypothetical protein
LNERTIAKKLFDDLIKPIFNTDVSYLNVDYSMILLFLIMHFENTPDYEDSMKQLIRFIIRKLDNRSYEELFKKIMKKIENFRSNEFILDLFRHYSRWLDEQIGPFTEFTWRMPNVSLPGHQEVEEFFKSDAQQCNYSKQI